MAVISKTYRKNPGTITTPDTQKVSTERFPLLPHRVHYPLKYYQSRDVADVYLETQWNTAAKKDYVVRIVFVMRNGQEHFVVLERDEVAGFLAKES